MSIRIGLFSNSDCSFSRLAVYSQSISKYFSILTKTFPDRRNWSLQMAKRTTRHAAKTRIEDVAKAAGVSIATVSRVATGSDRVSPELRTRVLKAAAEQIGRAH